MEEEIKKDMKTNEEEQEIKTIEIDNNKEKNNIKLILIIFAILLAIVIGIYIFLIKFHNKDIVPSDEPNDISTPNNESTISDDTTNTNGKKLYIYAKGFAENGPIAFTYNCVSEKCSIKITKKGIILYDEDIVQYRELTQYEYNQIYNSDSPIGGILDKDGFVEVKSEKIEQSEIDGGEIVDDEDYEPVYYFRNIYIIENEVYILGDSNNEILTYEEYRTSEFNQEVTVIDNYILADGCLYNYINKKIFCNEESRYLTENSNYGKIGNIYYFKTYATACPCEEYIIYNASTDDFKENVIYISNDIKDQIYYMEDINNETNVFLVNKEGETKVHTIKDVDFLNKHISKNKIAYLDKEKKLHLRNLNTGVFIQYDMSDNTYGELSGVKIIGVEDNKIEVYVGDMSVFEDETKRQSAKEQSKENKKSIEYYEKILEENIDPPFDRFYLGYKIIFDKDLNFVSKEYYVEIE